MNKLQQWIKKIWMVLRHSVNRFPETIIISFVFVIVMIVNNRIDYDPEQTLVKVSLILAMGIPLSATLKLVIERYNLKSIFRGLALLIMLLYFGLFYAFIPDTLGERFDMRYAMASAIVYLLFTLIPYLWQREKYSLYCVKLIVSFFITYLYTLVLYLGVIAIIFAVDFLFELDISNDIYFDTFITAVGVFGLTYFLGKVPKIQDDLSDYKYPVVLRVLLVSIIVPLISIYTLVLHAYLVRVIVSIGWSDGFVSQLVIWYGFVSVVLMVLLYPLKEESKIVAYFYKFYPYAMIIPMVMLAITMAIRVNAYGLTVLRVSVLLSWLWFVLSIIYVLVRKGKASQWLIAVFIVIFGLGFFGPLNAFSLSDANQMTRLTLLMEDAGILEGKALIPQPQLDEASRILISDLLLYLDRYEGLSRVDYLPKDFELEDMESLFGFSHISNTYYVDDLGQTYVNYYNVTPVVTDIAGYDYHAMVTSIYGKQALSMQDGLLIRDDEMSLQIILDGDVLYEKSIDDLLIGQEASLSLSESGPPISVDVREDWGLIKVVFEEVVGTLKDEQLKVDHYRAQVFVQMH